VVTDGSINVAAAQKEGRGLRVFGAMKLLRSDPLLTSATVLGVLATLLVSALPFASFAYRSPSLHVAVETAAGLIALFTAYLVFGRFRWSGRRSDLLLTCALSLFAVANLFVSALPAALSSDANSGSFATWAPLAGRLAGAALFAASAFGADRRVRSTSRSAALALFGCGAAVGVIAAVVAGFSSSLPRGIDPTMSPHESPVIAGEPAVVALQLVAMVLFAAAAVGFWRRGLRSDDELMRWLAAGSVLAAFAALNYFLFPSLYSEWIYTGDVLRIAFYLLLLAGAAREIGGYWRNAAHAAVLEERQRLARDLHDGLAQELAFITSQARRLAERGRDPVAEQIAIAGERALDESRRAISALVRTPAQPFPSLVAQAAEDVGARAGLDIDLNLADGVEAPPETQEALLRVVREAVTNAARHARAKTVRIELSNGTSGLHLRIKDDGRGFDPRTRDERRHQLGLTSMRERVRAVGGDLRIISEPGAGTEIDVAVP